MSEYEELKKMLSQINSSDDSLTLITALAEGQHIPFDELHNQLSTAMVMVTLINKIAPTHTAELSEDMSIQVKVTINPEDNDDE